MATAAIAAAAVERRLLVVGGGGPFADTVRRIDLRFRLPDETAHWMAVLAMDQYAHLLAARIAGALTEPPDPLPGAVLLERHGAVAVGMSLDQALDRLELVEVLCRTWRDALLIRAALATLRTL